MSIDTEFRQMMEEELEKAYPSNIDDDEIEPTSEREQELINRYAEEFKEDLQVLDQFSEEFEEELQGKYSRKMMFVMDVAIHMGETPSQLRQIIDEKGVAAIYSRLISW
jgi:hypothetical protein